MDPAGHAVQPELSLFAYVPAGHCAQTEAIDALK
jgi:hypothetical protein